MQHTYMIKRPYCNAVHRRMAGARLTWAQPHFSYSQARKLGESRLSVGSPTKRAVLVVYKRLSVYKIPFHSVVCIMRLGQCHCLLLSLWWANHSPFSVKAAFLLQTWEWGSPWAPVQTADIAWFNTHLLGLFLLIQFPVWSKTSVLWNLTLTLWYMMVFLGKHSMCTWKIRIFLCWV